jgi:large subunit ribosomal protein L6
MSRVGRALISIPAGVSLARDGQTVTVTGPKGSLSCQLLEGISFDQNDGQILISRPSDEAIYRARHGLMRALLNNMVSGVSQGFSKQLEVNGVGFRVSQAGNDLKFSLGRSHDNLYHVPEGIQIAIDQNIITVSGIDKQKVGQVAAEIRTLKKPEPYKGKGIKYVGERILRKTGKSGKEK